MAMPPPPDAPYRAGHRRTAFAIAIALAAAFAWGALRLAQLRFSPSEWQPSTWVDGHAGQLINTALGTLPGQARMDRWSAALRYRLMGDLGQQVREGCPGWLFYRDGLRPPPTRAHVLSQRIDLMRRWASRLEQAGVHLVVATVPDKSRIESKHLCGLHRAPLMHARWNTWQAALATAGVPLIDLRPPLASLPQAFYRTDVHMAPAGAEAAADRIGEALLPLLGGKGETQFVESAGRKPEVHMGDLLVLADLAQAPGGWRPPVEQFLPTHLEAKRSGGLLDDVAPVEVLLVGDSNGLRSDFSGRLGRSLGREVWNLSQDGGYFSGAMLDALARQDRWPHSLKVVVWVFSELSLSLPLSAQEQRAWAAMH